MADDDLKIFISWSGDLSKSVTRVIRSWLPKLFDRIDPWMSDVDIQAGTRGLQLIEDRLNESAFGIIVVTTENQHKTWLNFEAGALSKRFEGGSGRVVPILVNFDDFYQIDGPIRQFQGVMLDKDGMRELLQSISNIAESDWPMIEARFEWSWAEFDKAIQKSLSDAGTQPPAPDVTEADLLHDILGRLKSIEKTTGSTKTTVDRSPRIDFDNDSYHAITTVLSACGIGDVLSWTAEYNGTEKRVHVVCASPPDKVALAAAKAMALEHGFTIGFHRRMLAEEDVASG